MTPLKTFLNAKTALHRNKSSCLLHTGQTERHRLLQLHKTNTRFSEEGTQSPSELNHFPSCLGNHRILCSTASLQLQNPNPKNNSELPIHHETRGLGFYMWGMRAVKNLPGTESKSPSRFVCRQQTKHSKFYTQPQYSILSPLLWPTLICNSLVLV